MNQNIQKKSPVGGDDYPGLVTNKLSLFVRSVPTLVYYSHML